jgi:hypothetical protein
MLESTRRYFPSLFGMLMLWGRYSTICPKTGSEVYQAIKQEPAST